MGNCLPAKEKEDKIKGDFKVIILGISGSGKTTFAKQMKILYCDGFDEQETEYFKDVLTRNLIIGMRELVKLAKKFNIAIEEANVPNSETIEGYSYDEPLTENNKDIIKALWNDKGIKEVWLQCNSFQIQMTQYEYYMEHIDRIASPEFIPSQDDILRARQRTTGAYTTTFIANKYCWHLIDVGGQVPERQKWEQIMADGIQSMLFFSPLDDYNVMSSEETDQTKMQISFSVFQRLVKSAQKYSSAITMFFNKVDLFEKKVENKVQWKAFTSTFPDYEGEQDATEAANYIRDYFLDSVKQYTESSDNSVRVFCHVTCAIDTDSCSKVFNDVCEHVVMSKIELFV